MTNVRKNFQNYELDELFHLQSGIIELLNLATPELSDEGWTNIYFVISLLQDLQKEITYRIPKDLLTK